MPNELHWCTRGYHHKPMDEFYNSVQSECKSCFRERIRIRKGPYKTLPGSNARRLGLRRRLDPVSNDETIVLIEHELLNPTESSQRAMEGAERYRAEVV